VVNPRAGYELELSAPRAAGARIAVVGGGPAGMEAARSLAAAGNAVDLFEASDRLGGQFRMALRIPGKEDFERTIEYFERELPALGVAVRLHAPVTEAAALAEYDAVVVATGVIPRAIDLPGAGLPHVISYAEFLRGGAEASGDVAIIGAGGIGVDLAHLLSHPDGGGDPRRSFYGEYGLLGERPPARRDRRVTLLRRGPRVAERIGPSTRWAVVDGLTRAGVEILTGVAYAAIEPDAVVLEDGRRIPAQTVIVAAGQERRDELASHVGLPHVVIGGAAGAGELDAERAFREGALAGSALGLELLGSRP
jgi:2,4-dienoyl-CoA reductase (NADPH2)